MAAPEDRPGTAAPTQPADQADVSATVQSGEQARRVGLFDSVSDDAAARTTAGDGPAAGVARRAAASAAGPVQVGDAGARLSSEEAGRYHLEREFGRGGQAVVWLAHDAHVGRHVAFKQMLPGRGGSGPVPSSAAVRFLREARITGQLEHPGIVPVHELGRRADGSLYYTQKLIRGRTLRAALDACGTLRERLSLLSHFADVCQAVAYAHGRGVLHRDLKPENVMVGEFGETVVLDWGLAKIRGSKDEAAQALDSLPPDGAHATLDGAVLGTPLYMSPEQALGKLEQVDERSDVWGLGAVLFEILAGRAPFGGSTSQEVLREVINKPVPAVRTFAPDAPPELIAVAARALERDPARRYASARELAQEIVAWQSGARVGAYEYSSWELLRRFVQRNQLLSAVVALSVLVLLVSTVLVHRAHRETLSSLADALSARARDAEGQQRWSYAETYWAATRVEEERSEARWGEAIAHQLAPSPLRRLPSKSGQVWTLALSPDGARIATGGDDGELRIFAVGSGALLQSVPGPAPILAMAWRGPVLATTAGRALQLRGEDGRVVRELSQEADLRSVALSADGALVATGDVSGGLRLYETGSGRERWRLEIGHDKVTALAFAPDGERLAVGSADGTTVVRDLQGRELARLAVPEIRVWSLAFSPDGLRLLVGGSAGTLRLWTPGAAGLPQRFEGHLRVISSVAFSADGRIFASSSRDGLIRLWDARAGRPLAAFEGGERAVDAVAFTPDGSTLAAANEDSSARLWALPRPQPQAALLGHTGKVYGVAFSSSDHAAPDHDTLASASEDGTVRLWDPARGAQTAVLQSAGQAVHALATGEDGSIAWGADDGRVRVRSPDGTTRDLAGHTLVVSALALRGGALASVSHDASLRLWDLATGSSRVVAAGQKMLHAVAISPDGALVATGGDDTTVKLWDARTLGLVRVLAGHPGRLRAVAFSPDGKLLASGSNNRVGLVFRVADGEIVARLEGHEGPVRAVAFSPTGDVLATASADHTVRLWDLPSGEPLARLARQDDEVESLAWSSRYLLAMGSGDRTIELLQLAELEKLPGPKAALREVLERQWLKLVRLQVRER